MASDMIEGMGPARVEGNNVVMSIHPDSRRDADRIFTELAHGGSITMPRPAAAVTTTMPALVIAPSLPRR